MMSFSRIRNHTLLLPIYLPAVFASLSLGITDPVLPLLAQELGADFAMVGITVSAMTFGMLLTDLPGGIVLSRLGERKTMLLGTFTAGLGGVAMLWVENVAQAILLRMLLGVGFSLFALARHTYIAERVPVGDRGQATAMFGGVARAARLAGPFIGGTVAYQLNLRAPFALIGGLWFFTFLAVFAYMPKTQPIITDQPVTIANYTAQIGRTWREHWRILLSAGTGQFLAQLVRRGRSTIIPLFGKNVLGLDVDEIGLVMSIAQGFDTALFYPAGVLMDRFGRKFAIIPSFLLQALGFILLPFTTSFWTLTMVTSMIGLGSGIGSGTMMTLGADLSPRYERSTFLGTWRMMGSAGFTASPIIIGTIADALSLTEASMVIGGLGLMSSFLFARFVPETLKKKIRGAVSAD